MWYGHRRRFFGGTLRVDYTGQGNDFELIPTVKMETIHPVEGYFCSKFSAICNHFGVMAAWSHKMLEIFRKSKRFWKNNPLQENFQNSVVKVVIATRIDVLSSNFMKFGGQEIGEIVGWLPKKKKFASLSRSHYCVDRAKICQGQPLTMYPNQFTFGEVIAKCMNNIKTQCKVNPIFSRSLASSRIKNTNLTIGKHGEVVKKPL